MSDSDRDRDWILAMAAALGTDSHYDIPIVPTKEAFANLFANMRAREGKNDGYIREVKSWPGDSLPDSHGVASGERKDDLRPQEREEGVIAKTVYLANPCGFSRQQRGRLLPEIVEKLRSLGLDVWEPFARNNQIAENASSGRAHRIATRDVQDVRDADGFFAVINGCPPDEGVMVELGIAIALQKPIFLFRDDFRRCSDSEDYPLNLMVFAGLPAERWEDAYYTSVESITDPNRVLAQWARSEDESCSCLGISHKSTCKYWVLPL